MAGLEQRKLSKKEVAVLNILHDNPSNNFNPFSLVMALDSGLHAGTEKYKEAFDAIRAATEQLYLLKLVKGIRLKGVNGIYFGSLELTPEGERKVIEMRSCSN